MVWRSSIVDPLTPSVTSVLVDALVAHGVERVPITDLSRIQNVWDGLQSCEHLRHYVHSHDLAFAGQLGQPVGAMHLPQECVILGKLLTGHAHRLGCAVKDSQVAIVSRWLVDLTFNGLEGAREVRCGLSQVGVKLGDPERVVVLPFVNTVPEFKTGCVIDVYVVEFFSESTIGTKTTEESWGKLYQD